MGGFLGGHVTCSFLEVDLTLGSVASRWLRLGRAVAQQLSRSGLPWPFEDMHDMTGYSGSGKSYSRTIYSRRTHVVVRVGGGSLDLHVRSRGLLSTHPPNPEPDANRPQLVHSLYMDRLQSFWLTMTVLARLSSSNFHENRQAVSLLIKLSDGLAAGDLKPQADRRSLGPTQMLLAAEKR
ncbi:hypothetical protein LIA77_08561 [Sarocladium implicatum]|nr:hypothetical protein LIA77_08561 [Sarocladium implicatum]